MDTGTPPNYPQGEGKSCLWVTLTEAPMVLGHLDKALSIYLFKRKASKVLYLFSFETQLYLTLEKMLSFPT